LAQDGGLTFTETPDGVVVSGSVTVEGIVYEADGLVDLARAYLTDPAAMGALPSGLMSVVGELLARGAVQGGTP